MCRPTVTLTAALLATTALADPVFTNVTTQAGINFTNHAAINHSGVCAVDLTGDGYAELFFNDVAGFNNELYLNNGDGTFTEVGAAWGVRTPEITISQVFFDLDNDGRLDVALNSQNAGGENRVRLLRNVGGGFIDISDAAGLLERFTELFFKGITAFDHDGDGFLDLFVGVAGECSTAAPGNLVYHNNGDGTMTLMLPCLPMSDGCINWQPLAADLNADGRTDVFVPEDTWTQSRVFINRLDGLLEDVGFNVGITKKAPDMGVVAWDYDNDGDLDVYTTDYTIQGMGGNRLFRSALSTGGGLMFTDVAKTAGVSDTGFSWGVTSLDYDNDRWLDLAVTNSAGASRLFRNRADGTFENVSSAAGFAPVGTASGLAAVDYDLDGDLDLILTNTGGPALLFRNDGGNAANWLRVRLADRTGHNPQAIGSRVTLTAGGVTQLRELTSGMSFYSQEDGSLLFGLGSAPHADVITVTWPDGSWNSASHVSPRQTIQFVRVQGDFDGDGSVTPADIEPFVNALMGDVPDDNVRLRADVNRDGRIDGFDIEPFLALLVAP
ncbi:MAG: hypothetical protein CHACPFDD_02409 [Phycisphaerae bacterium]|nr:hypothetical protein [Phycisphaerae bacterium]